MLSGACAPSGSEEPLHINQHKSKLMRGGFPEAVSKLGKNGEKRPGEHVLRFAGNAGVSANAAYFFWGA
jgi:hypothetical protein